jgi:hypothetical protein
MAQVEIFMGQTLIPKDPKVKIEYNRTGAKGLGIGGNRTKHEARLMRRGEWLCEGG